MFPKYFIILSVVIKIIFMKDECENGKCAKILDGEFTTIKKFPHAVAMALSMENGLLNFCGGSVLTQRIVLTAAHCVQINTSYTWLDAFPDNVFIAAGHENFYQSSIMQKVKESIVHDCYNDENFRNDIALLFLSEDLPLSPTIKPVVITREFPIDVKKADVSGRGATNASVLNATSIATLEIDAGTHTDILKYVTIKIYSQRKCCKIIQRLGQRIHNFTGHWHPGMMCGGDRHADEFKNQPMPGDSGGALVFSENHQIGVVSLGLFGGGKRGVVIFSNVTYYYDWILVEAKKLYHNNHLPFDKNTILTNVSPK